MTPSLQLKAADYAETTPKDRLRVQPILFPIPEREGYVFAIIAVEKQKPTDPTPLPVIEHHLEDFTERFANEAHPQRQFEIFLNALNTDLAEHVRRGAWSTPINQFHAVVGVVCEEHMFLSGTGDVSALFLHRKPSSQRYQVFNLARSIQTEQALPTWEKPFAVVLDGDMHTGDVLCLSNQDLVRTIDQEELNTLLASLPPKSAVAKIRQYFPASTNLSLVIIKGDANEALPSTSSTATPVSHASIEDLEQMQQKTDDLLGESTSPLATLTASRKKTSSPSRTAQDSIRATRPPSTAVRIGSASVRMIGSAVAGIGHLIIKPFTRDRSVAMPSMKARPNIKKPKAWFKALPKSSKGLLVAALGCIVLFGLGTGAFLYKRAEGAKRVAYESQVARVEDLLTQAEGALIYKDRTKAKQLIENAKTELATLPATTPEEQMNIERLTARIDTHQDNLRNIIRVSQPTTLGNLPEGTTGAALVKIGPDIIVLDTEANAYKQTTDGSALAKEEGVKGSVGRPLSVAVNNTQVLFLDDRPGLSSYDTESKQSKVLEYDVQKYAPRAITTYNGRLYALGTLDGAPQILRSSSSSNGFGTPSAWIKTRTSDLTNAVSLAIDTRIYVLTSSGTITAFLEGNELGWKSIPIDPPLTATTSLLTDSDSDYLYVLEPTTKRIVVFKKQDGTFVSQYEFTTDTTPVSFAVDETTKTLFLLTANTLLSTSLTHLP